MSTYQPPAPAAPMPQPATCPFASISHSTSNNVLTLTSYSRLDGTATPYQISAPTDTARFTLFDTYWTTVLSNPTSASCVNPMLNNPSYVATNSAVVQQSMAALNTTNNMGLGTAIDTEFNSLGATNSGVSKAIKDMGSILALGGAPIPFLGRSSYAPSDAQIMSNYGPFILKLIIMVLILAVFLSLTNIPRDRQMLIIVSVLITTIVCDSTYSFITSFRPSMCKATCGC